LPGVPSEGPQLWGQCADGWGSTTPSHTELASTRPRPRGGFPFPVTVAEEIVTSSPYARGFSGAVGDAPAPRFVNRQINVPTCRASHLLRGLQRAGRVVRALGSKLDYNDVLAHGSPPPGLLAKLLT
jgi:hypothetical protein